MTASEEQTARLKLPLLWAGQAQKELFHNEALTLLDLCVQASVLDIGVIAPPSDPSEGDMWVVGTAANGAWEGCDAMLAGWTAGGWRFVVPQPGMQLWSQRHSCFAVFTDGEWRVGALRGRSVAIDGKQVVGERRPAIADPIAGGVVDSEARAAVSAILDAMRSHGLIEAN